MAHEPSSKCEVYFSILIYADNGRGPLRHLCCVKCLSFKHHTLKTHRQDTRAHGHTHTQDTRSHGHTHTQTHAHTHRQTSLLVVRPLTASPVTIWNVNSRSHGLVGLARTQTNGTNNITIPGLGGYTLQHASAQTTHTKPGSDNPSFISRHRTKTHI